MSNRDPKTGRFVKKERTIRVRLPNEFKPTPGAVLSADDYYQGDFKPIGKISDLKVIKYESAEEAYKTKTPTNYWNYILVGVLGAVMLVIGYELHELLPIL